jgi:hypothetical protein
MKPQHLETFASFYLFVIPSLIIPSHHPEHASRPQTPGGQALPDQNH